MFDFIRQHSFWSAIAAYWIFSAAVSAMPEPKPNSGAYLWLYNFLHTIAGNLTTAFGSKIPGLPTSTTLKTLALIVTLPLLLSASACAGYHVHPGALNSTDSVTYDVLLVAESAIDQARSDYTAGLLPDTVKTPFNKLVLSYNLTREAWLTYRGAIATNSNPALYLDKLNQDLTELRSAIADFKGVK